MKTLEIDDAEFIRGFAATTNMELPEAREQWAFHSRQLTDSDRQGIEALGYESGVNEGQLFNDLYK